MALILAHPRRPRPPPRAGPATGRPAAPPPRQMR